MPIVDHLFYQCDNRQTRLAGAAGALYARYQASNPTAFLKRLQERIRNAGFFQNKPYAFARFDLGKTHR